LAKGANFSGANAVITISYQTATTANIYPSGQFGTVIATLTVPAASIPVVSTDLETWGLFTIAVPAFPTATAALLTQIGVSIAYTPTGTAGAADSLHMSQALLVPGSNTPIPWKLAANTPEEEFRLCQAFYEKTYPEFVDPGSGGTVGVWFSEVNNVNTANGAVWPICFHPRFCVRKDVTYFTPVVTVWAPGGVAGTWEIPTGTIRTTTTAFIGEYGFVLVNNTGSTVTPATGMARGNFTVECEH
jgi:hypothetical protein